MVLVDNLYVDLYVAPMHVIMFFITGLCNFFTRPCLDVVVLGSFRTHRRAKRWFRNKGFIVEFVKLQKTTTI